VRQEIANGDFPARRDDVVRNLPFTGSPATPCTAAPATCRSGPWSGDGHLHGLVLRQEPGHRIVQSHLALFDKHHDGHARNRLRHRGEAEDAVFRYGLLGFDILHALCIEVRNSTAAGHQRDHARYVPRVEMTLHELADSQQTLR
jgi:hypothetical protein